MVDEHIRQRIKYLVEHGDVIPSEPPATRRWLLAVGIIIAVLQLVDIIIHLR